MKLFSRTLATILSGALMTVAIVGNPAAAQAAPPPPDPVSFGWEVDPLPPPPSLPGVPEEETPSGDRALDAALARVSALAPTAGPDQVAYALFPGDEVARVEAEKLLTEAEAAILDAQLHMSTKVKGLDGTGVIGPQGVPVMVAAAMPYIVRCTKGALGSTGVGTVVHLAIIGDMPRAKEFAVSAVAGCIGSIGVPRWLARRVAHQAVGSVIWIIVRVYR